MALRLSEGLGRTARNAKGEGFLVRSPLGCAVSPELVAGAVLRRCGVRRNECVSRKESRGVEIALTMDWLLGRCDGEAARL